MQSPKSRPEIPFLICSIGSISSDFITWAIKLVPFITVDESMKEERLEKIISLNTDGDVVVQNKYIHYSIHASTTNTFYTRPGISTAATTCPIGYEIRVLRAGGNYRCSTHAGCRAINTDLSIFHSYPVTTMDAYGTTLDTIPDVAKDGEVSCAWLVCEAL